MRHGATAWPPELAELYRTEGYWRGLPLGRLPEQWAARYGDRTALVDGTTRITYRELATRVESAATNLTVLGLEPGDNLLVQLPNCHQLVLLVLACARIGVAPVLLLPAHRERELVALGRHTGAVALATTATTRGYDHAAQARRVAEQVPSIRRLLIAGCEEEAGTETDLDALLDSPPVLPAALPDPDPSDVALFLLSGGTTGTPKVIARTHNDYEYNFRGSAAVCGFDTGTVYLAALPAAHNFVLGSPGVLGTLASGGQAVFVASPSPTAVFDAIKTHEVTHLAAVPAVLRRWMESAELTSIDLPSLRVVQVGGERLEPETVRRAARVLDCRIQQVFGMAEGLLNYTRPDDSRWAVEETQGRPMSPHDEIRVIGANGEETAAGEPGELLTRGPYTPRGYFRAPEYNRTAFTADGWFRTGDVVRRDAAGNLVVVGRIKDVINRGGEKIAADEIEHLLAELPEIADAAVVPYPDPDLGERVGAFVVLREGRTLTTGEAVRRLTASGIAAYKLPERLWVVDTLPQTAVGKTDKQALRRLVADRAATPQYQH
ncbi:(2,3-dihydroxybenzoyl)adenylate synthase [Kitasatospora sp. NPDC057541]|uniref:(2,3-dihydroxybenzoyl)adenylate synthase n=1 Tax=unclassified Kitasatospora TaxID=2633591 RepID=UPI0036AAA68C